MNIQELRQLTPKKLTAELDRTRRAFAVAKFQIRTGKNQNNAELGKLRRIIARILTLVGGKQVSQSDSKK